LGFHKGSSYLGFQEMLNLVNQLHCYQNLNPSSSDAASVVAQVEKLIRWPSIGECAILDPPLAIAMHTYCSNLLTLLPIQHPECRVLCALRRKGEVDLVTILLRLITKPPFRRSGSSLFIICFKLLSFIPSISGEYGDQVRHQMIHELHVREMMKFHLADARDGNSAALLDTLLLCRPYIDFNHSGIACHAYNDMILGTSKDEEMTKIGMLPAIRLSGLWHIATQTMTSAIDVVHCNIGILKIDVDLDTGKVTGNGFHSTFGDLTLQSNAEDDFHEMVFFPSRYDDGIGVKSSNSGKNIKIILSGSMEAWTNTAGGIWTIMDRKQHFDDQHTSTRLGGWFAWKDSRDPSSSSSSSSQSVYEEEKMKIITNHSIPASFESFEGMTEEEFEEMIHAANVPYSLLIRHGHHLMRISHWARAPLSLIKSCAQEMIQYYAEYGLNPRNVVMETGALTRAQTFLERGPYESLSTFEARCYTYALIHRLIEMLRQGIIEALLPEINITLPHLVVEQQSQQSQQSQQQSQQQPQLPLIVGSMKHWFARLLFCPFANPLDPFMDDADMQDFVHKSVQKYHKDLLEEEEEANRQNSAQHSNSTQSPSQIINEVFGLRQTKKMVKRDQMSMTTLAIALCFVSIVSVLGAFTIGRWSKNKSKRQ
jgi:hypothetical protein